jgi:endo-1,4-beta-xylanase
MMHNATVDPDATRTTPNPSPRLAPTLLCILAPLLLAAAPTLRTAAPPTLTVGVAVNFADLKPGPVADLVAAHFTSLTATNDFKPDRLQPRPGQFTFAAADRIADAARDRNLQLVGHTLLWHEQAPRWMFQNADGKPLPREQALANLRAHVVAVATHFRGRVRGWDVVNEALAETDGGGDFRDTPARRAIGDDYVEHAFRFAREADPDAELYYNDFNIELPKKRDRALRLIRRLKAAGLRIDAVGIQGHWGLTHPPVAVIDDAIRAFHAEGVKVMITELDVDVLPRRRQGADLQATEASGADPYRDGCPPEVLAAQARRYGDLFRVFVKHRDAVTRVTFWGTHDGTSWLNNFPVRGRTNHPLLWDRQLRPKPAFDAVIEALRTAK